MQTGCLVPFQFTNSSIEAMKGAKILKVGAKAYSGGKDAIFNASLKGFQAAVERLRVLQQ
jgi:invasion protein IalB